MIDVASVPNELDAKATELLRQHFYAEELVAALKNSVVLTLREMLLRGDFEPGERLTELSLVPRLKASRTPVRLALDRLRRLRCAGSHDGFVQNFGARERLFDVVFHAPLLAVAAEVVHLWEIEIKPRSIRSISTGARPHLIT